jgi:hypothetical protein
VTLEAASGKGQSSGTKTCAAVLEKSSEDISFKKPINRTRWESELALKIFSHDFQKKQPDHHVVFSLSVTPDVR